MRGPTIQWVDGLVGAVQPAKEIPGTKSVERIVSHHMRVKSELRRQATLGANQARGLLALHQANEPGESTWIEMSGPSAGHKLDYSVHLYASKPARKGSSGRTSNHGLVAAMSIEYGHTGTGAGGPVAPFQQAGKEYPGLFILHRAFGMKRR